MRLIKLKIIFPSLLVGALVLIFTGFGGAVVAQNDDIPVSAPEGQADTEVTTRGTLLPATSLSTQQCRILMGYVSGDPSSAETALNDRANLQNVPGLGDVTHNSILACGIRTGAMKLWMIPYYIRFMLEFVISLAGLIAVAGTVYGGYLYMFGGISDEKEKGKKAIMYGVIGMIMTLVAWAVVNIFIALLTRL